MKSQDFYFLRTEGIKLIQKYAGISKKWTDYNTHDPGITILEHLVYAITEIGLLADLPASTLLSVPIKKQLATILNNGACNDFDKRKLILEFIINNQRVFKNAKIQPIPKYAPFVFEEEVRLNFENGQLIPMKGGQCIILSFWDDALNQNIIPLELEITKNLEITFPFIDTPEIPATIDSSFTLQSIVVNTFSQIELNQYSVSLETSFLQSGINYNYGFHIFVKPHEFELDAVTQTQLTTKLEDVNEPTNPINLFFKKIQDFNTHIEQLQSLMLSNRPLGEDYFSFEVRRTQEIGLDAQIDVQIGTNITKVLADIFFNIDQFLSPSVPIYDLFEIQEQEKINIENILEGIQLQNGFIKNEDLANSPQKKNLYTSDLLKIIMQGEKEGDGKRIINVREFSISNSINNILVTSGVQNCLKLIQPELYGLKLGIFKSNIRFYQNGQRLYYDLDDVIAIFNDKKKEVHSINNNNSISKLNVFNTPDDIGNYFSIQNEFPLPYAIGKGALETNESTSRKAQVKQLKAYLLPFEQLLAKTKTAIQASSNPTLFDTPDIDELLIPFTNGVLSDFSEFITDEINEYAQLLRGDYINLLKQKERKLDHSIAQFGESLLAYSQMMNSIYPSDNISQLQLRKKQLKDKELLLEKIDELGKNRGIAYHYAKQENGRTDVWNTTNIGGYAKRIARLLGIQNAQRRNLSMDKNIIGNFFEKNNLPGGEQNILLKENGNTILESIMLRPAESDILEDDIMSIMYLGVQIHYYQSRFFTGQIYATLFNQENIAIAKTPLFSDPTSLSNHLNNKVIPLLKQITASYENQGEGLYVIEHILLRPLVHDGVLLFNGYTSDPYSFQITVLLPSGWQHKDEVAIPTTPARFRDFAKGLSSSSSNLFKRYTNQLIKDETPAHLMVNIVWLDRSDTPSQEAETPYLEEFETVYKAWLESKANPNLDLNSKQNTLNNFLSIFNRILQYGISNNNIN